MLAALVAFAAACDFSPTLDIETPAHEPAVVLRAVLSAGEPLTVRVSESRDPFVEGERAFGAAPTRIDGRLTLVREGGAAEVLGALPQTCIEGRQTACDPATGRTVVVEEGRAFECGRYQGAVPVEAGATYTLRAEVPGLPPAEATVTVPPRPDVSVEAASGVVGARALRVRLRDAPGPSWYGLTVLHEVDRFQTSVCRRGGVRDTTVLLPSPWVTRVRFATDDAVLLAASRSTGAAVEFAAFDDGTFADAARTFAVESPPPAAFGATGAVRVEVAALSREVYDAYQITTTVLDEDNPFAEPVDLPSNVVGGFGRVGAVARTVVAVQAR